MAEMLSDQDRLGLGMVTVERLPVAVVVGESVAENVRSRDPEWLWEPEADGDRTRELVSVGLRVGVGVVVSELESDGVGMSDCEADSVREGAVSEGEGDRDTVPDRECVAHGEAEGLRLRVRLGEEAEGDCDWDRLRDAVHDADQVTVGNAVPVLEGVGVGDTVCVQLHDPLRVRSAEGEGVHVYVLDRERLQDRDVVGESVGLTGDRVGDDPLTESESEGVLEGCEGVWGRDAVGVCVAEDVPVPRAVAEVLAVAVVRVAEVLGVAVGEGDREGLAVQERLTDAVCDGLRERVAEAEAVPVHATVPEADSDVTVAVAVRLRDRGRLRVPLGVGLWGGWECQRWSTRQLALLEKRRASAWTWSPMPWT